MNKLIYNIINTSNIKILKEFIKLNNSKYFRYYDKRDIDIIKNHLITIIITDNDNNIIGYSHIDNENDINWFGICILDKYKGNSLKIPTLNENLSSFTYNKSDPEVESFIKEYIIKS